MHFYIDSVSFQGMNFVDALRYLCSLFMLPGEAQKIDRIIERFAAKYCSENTDQFSSGDVAYILAYSCILLHSNIYNANVKKKMSKPEFIKTNRAATTEVSDQQLSEIYDNICAKEMKLKDSDHDVKSSDNSTKNEESPSKKMRKLHQESRRLIRDVKNKIRAEAKNNLKEVNVKYVDPNDTDDKVLKLIFSASCYAVLGTFSVVIQTSEYKTHIKECYSGYRSCIQLASQLDMNTECEAFVNSLYRFTLLGTLKPIQMKNVQAMKLLLELGNNQGNLLRTSWKSIIKCCSEIDILHLMATQAPADGAFWLDKKSVDTLTIDGGETNNSDDIMQAVRETGTANHESRKLGARTRIGSDGILRFQSDPNSLLVSAHIDQNMVAKIFTGTEKLGPQAILEFVRYLCQVSSDEIMNHANPRSFCLQKIVDIAHFNMHRVRFEWIQLWAVLSMHFEKAGCHRNQQICIYAIDNLKQLADKFLEREELTTFNFQKDFLKPFLTIVATNKSHEIQEYIIQCMARLIRARYKNIKSGWKCVFGTLGVAARVNNEHLVGTTFDIMIEILDLYFPMISKMSTRPSTNNHNSSIFKIPEDSAIDSSAIDSTIDNNNLSDDETKDDIKESSESNNSNNSKNNNITFENEEQKQEHINKIQLLRIDAISDCVDTLLAFVVNKFTDLSISAVDHISKVAQYLFESDQYLPQQLTGSAMMESDLMISIDNVVRASNSSIFQFTSSMNGGKPDLSRPLIKAWFLCLLGLSKGVNDERLEVRTHCLQVLFRLLRAQGELFDDIMWQRVFERLLFPIFAELRQTKDLSSPPTPKDQKLPSINTNFNSFDSLDSHQREKRNRAKVEFELNGNLSARRRRSASIDENSYNNFKFNAQSSPEILRTNRSGSVGSPNSKPVYDDYSWLETTCHPALSNLVELFHQFFFICQPLLHDIVSLLCSFIVMKQSFDASQIGHQCLKRLIQALGPKFKSSQWTIVIADLIMSLKRTIPSQLKSDRLRSYFNLANENNNDNKQQQQQQNGHDVPNSILNVEKISILCTSQLQLMNSLTKISKQHLKKLTLYQCVDILNAFQSSQDFVCSITKDASLMNKLQFLRYTKNPSSPAKQAISIASLLYKLESTAFNSALSVLFECKNVSIKHLSTLQSKSTSKSPSKSNNSNDKSELMVDIGIDERVESQILNNSNTPPPISTISNMPLMQGIIPQKSVPEQDKQQIKQQQRIRIDNHKMTVNDIRQLSEYRLIPLGIQLMQLMYVRERKQLRSAQDTKYLNNVVSLFLKHLLSSDHFTDDEFHNKIRIVFPYLSRLIECNSIQIRELISKILLLRVSKCILNDKQQKNGSYLAPSMVPLMKNNSV